MNEDIDLLQTAAEVLEKLQGDERDVDAWRTLAQVLERLGSWREALNAQWAAMQLQPDRSDWLADLRRLADRVGDSELTEALLRDYVAITPAREAGVQVLANFLRDERRPDDAIVVLRDAIPGIQSPATLHNQLSGILGEQGLMHEALEEVEAALRMAPGWASALQNRAIIRLALGDIDGALTDGAHAIALSQGRERASIRLARSLTLLRAGRLDEGWRAYSVRLEPDYVGSMHFDIPLPRWTPSQSLTGARLLLVGELGLGDEIMFANAIPDLIPKAARLALAVTPRLIPLFVRSFPSVEVTHHHTRTLDSGIHRSVPGIDLSGYDVYAPLADVMQVLRPAIDCFPRRAGYLRPDPGRVAHWRAALASLPPGRKIGLSWKSMGGLKARNRFYAPFELWRPLFDRRDITIVNLQYGDIASEIAMAQTWDRPIWLPPGLDVQNDLDDLAALAAALDGVAGPLNASTAVAGAVGARVAAVCPGEAWTGFGTKALPWYPGSFLASPPQPHAWESAIAEVIEFL